MSAHSCSVNVIKHRCSITHARPASLWGGEGDERTGGRAREWGWGEMVGARGGGGRWGRGASGRPGWEIGGSGRRGDPRAPQTYSLDEAALADHVAKTAPRRGQTSLKAIIRCHGLRHTA